MDPDFYYRRQQHQQPPPPNQPAAERDLSWKCGPCGYHVLAMDQSGRGLPLELGPAGKVLPLMCPRCRQEHTHWLPASPFDAFGDHANLPSALSARVTHGASIFDAVHRFHDEQQSAQVRAEELNRLGPALGGGGGGAATTISRPTSSTGLVDSGRNSAALFNTGSIIIGATAAARAAADLGSMTLRSQGTAQQQQQHQHEQMLRRAHMVTPPPLSASQQAAHTALEYELLSEHDALKDPDVVAALQRLRRRHGPAPDSSLAGPLSALLEQQQQRSRDGLTEAQTARLPESSLQRAAAHRSTAPKSLETYVCALCGRRLLRVDHEGRLIPIEVDAQGNLTTIECPGCHQTHSQWVRTQLNGTISNARPQSQARF
jgi:hypothetical protein